MATFASLSTAYDPAADQVTVATPTCCSCCCCCLASTILISAYVTERCAQESRRAETDALGQLGDSQRRWLIVPIAVFVWLIALALELIIPAAFGISAGVSNYDQSFNNPDRRIGPWEIYLIAFFIIYPVVVWLSPRPGRAMARRRTERLQQMAARANQIDVE